MTKDLVFKPLRLAAKAADDKKAVDIIAFDVRKLTAIADALLFVGGTSHVHVRTIEDAIREALRETGATLKRTDGRRGYPWRALDYGDFIIHIMEQSTRGFYSLERLWAQGTKIPLRFKKTSVNRTKKRKKSRRTKKRK